MNKIGYNSGDILERIGEYKRALKNETQASHSTRREWKRLVEMLEDLLVIKIDQESK